MLRLRNSYFILRHASLTKEKRSILSSWPEKEPLSLSQKGRKQAQARVKQLKKEGIELIFSSDLRRAQETAEIIGRKLQLEVRFDSRLREFNFGTYNGKQMVEFYRDFPANKARFTRAVPGGENWQQAQRRMKDFLKEIDRQYRGKSILIVGHGDPLWLLEGAARGWSQERLLEEKRERFIRRGELRKL